MKSEKQAKEPIRFGFHASIIPQRRLSYRLPQCGAPAYEIGHTLLTALVDGSDGSDRPFFPGRQPDQLAAEALPASPEGFPLRNWLGWRLLLAGRCQAAGSRERRPAVGLFCP